MKKFIILAMLVLSLSISAETNSKTGNSVKENTENVSKILPGNGSSFETAIKVNTVEEEYKYHIN